MSTLVRDVTQTLGAWTAGLETVKSFYISLRVQTSTVQCERITACSVFSRQKGRGQVCIEGGGKQGGIPSRTSHRTSDVSIVRGYKKGSMT